MNIENNYPPGAKNRDDAPYNDQSMDCPECDDGLDRDGRICIYCDGIGVISERYYNDIKSLEREENNL